MLFGETPFRLKELRVWPVLRIVMYHVKGNIDQHSWKKYHLTTTSQSKLGGTFGNEQPVVMPIFCAHSVIPRDRGEDPQSLFDARLQVGHVRDGLVVQPPPVSLKDLINLTGETRTNRKQYLSTLEPATMISESAAATHLARVGN